MMLAEQSVISVYLDLTAFLMIAGLINLSARFRRRGQDDDKLFLSLCLSVMGQGLFSAISYALHDQLFAWGRPVALLSKTLVEFAMWNVIYFWILFVDFKLYGSREHLVRRYRVCFVPLVIFAALLLVNLFTGILFTIRPDLHYTSTVLYDVMMVVQMIYFLIPAGIVLQYRIAHGGTHFFHIGPVILPSFAGAMVNLFTPYSATALGVAVGLVFLYFSMVNAWRFDDPETGFYNKEYLQYVRAQVREGKRDCRSVLVFQTDGDRGVLTEILKQEIPRDGELIAMDNGAFVLLLSQGNRSAIDLLKLLIEEAVQEYEEAHGGTELNLAISDFFRSKQEDASAFLEAHIG